MPLIQLFNLKADIGEQRNVQAENSVVVERLTRLMEKYVVDGRSTPGAPQKNAVAVNFHSGEQHAPPVRKGKAKAKKM